MIRRSLGAAGLTAMLAGIAAPAIAAADDLDEQSMDGVNTSVEAAPGSTNDRRDSHEARPAPRPSHGLPVFGKVPHTFQIPGLPNPVRIPGWPHGPRAPKPPQTHNNPGSAPTHSNPALAPAVPAAPAPTAPAPAVTAPALTAPAPVDNVTAPAPVDNVISDGLAPEVLAGSGGSGDSGGTDGLPPEALAGSGGSGNYVDPQLESEDIAHPDVVAQPAPVEAAQAPSVDQGGGIVSSGPIGSGTIVVDDPQLEDVTLAHPDAVVQPAPPAPPISAQEDSTAAPAEQRPADKRRTARQ